MTKVWQGPQRLRPSQGGTMREQRPSELKSCLTVRDRVVRIQHRWNNLTDKQRETAERVEKAEKVRLEARTETEQLKLELAQAKLEIQHLDQERRTYVDVDPKRALECWAADRGLYVEECWSTAVTHLVDSEERVACKVSSMLLASRPWRDLRDVLERDGLIPEDEREPSLKSERETFVRFYRYVDEALDLEGSLDGMTFEGMAEKLGEAIQELKSRADTQLYRSHHLSNGLFVGDLQREDLVRVLRAEGADSGVEYLCKSDCPRCAELADSKPQLRTDNYVIGLDLAPPGRSRDYSAVSLMREDADGSLTVIGTATIPPGTFDAVVRVGAVEAPPQPAKLAKNVDMAKMRKAELLQLVTALMHSNLAPIVGALDHHAHPSGMGPAKSPCSVCGDSGQIPKRDAQGNLSRWLACHKCGDARLAYLGVPLAQQLGGTDPTIVDCSFCQGSGEALRGVTRCSVCKGTGRAP